MLEQTLEVLPDAMAAVGSDGTLIAANAAFHALFGYPAGALVGQPLAVLIPEGQRARHAEHQRAFLQAPAARYMGRAAGFEGRRQDGSRFAADIALSPAQALAPGGVLVAVRDVTELRRLEREAVEREERIRALMELARVGAWEVDLTRGVRTYSPELLAMLGRDAAHASDDEFMSAVHPDDRARLVQLMARAFAEGSGYRLELRMSGSTGEYRWMETQAFVDCGADGRPVRLRGLVTDIHDRRLAESQLASAERLATLGMVAAGVAHEINNPLAAIVFNLEALAGRVDRLRARLDQDEFTFLDEALRDALEGAARVRDIVRDVKVFAREGEAEVRGADLDAVVASSVRLMGPEIRRAARLRTALGGVPRVRGCPSRLGQVVVNLLTNAAEALDAHPAGENEKEIAVSTRLEPDGRVVLEVADNGPGIAPEARGRLFEPFYTTRAESGGTGLGLNICRRIVEVSGGEITFESAPGAGTRFFVRLQPASELPVPEEVGGGPEVV